MKKTLFLNLLLGLVLGSSAQITRTQVGNTTYDLQTNNSVARRIIVLPNGKKVITYTCSQSGDVDAVDRGTGYNYFDGSSWATTSFPYPTTFIRPENTRTGWPNPIVMSGNKEAILSHAVDGGGSYGIHQLRRTSTGSGTWSELSATNGVETWARVVNCGDSVLAIFSSSDPGTINGVTGGLGMIRSYDGGLTWSNVDTIPGINPNYYTSIGGDNYAIDIQGKNIAIVTGQYDVTLYKSPDFGNTWTKTTIINADNLNTSTLQPADRSDGAFTVSFDNSGVVHVMFGRNYNFYDDTTSTAGVYYSPYKNGIMYWNESMGNQYPKLIPQTVLTQSSVRHLRYIPAFNLYTNNGAISYNGYGSGYVSQPSMTVASNGTLFATFAKLIPDNDTVDALVTNRDQDGFNMDDIFAIKSNDNGKTWIGPLNVSRTDSLESYFACVAKYVDGNLHVLYQEDENYGNAIQANSTTGTATSGNKSFVDNKIIYAGVDTNAIVNPVDITEPELTYKDNLTTDTINAYVGCPFSISKKWLLDNFVNVFDNSIGSDTSLLQYTTNVNTSVVGTYYLRVIAVDASGNHSGPMYLVDNNNVITTVVSQDTLEFVINVTNTDVTAPTASLIGNDTAFVYLHTGYSDAGVNATDDNQCTLGQLSITSSNNIDTNAVGSYTYTWLVKDAANNSKSVTRTVIVGREPEPHFTWARRSSRSFQFIDSSLYSPTGWRWTFAPLTTTYTTKNPVVLFTRDTTVNVCLYSSNSFNAAPFNKPILSTCQQIFIDVWPTGIEGVLDEASVSLAPIPSKGELTMYLKDIVSAKAKVSIMNITGQTLITSDHTLTGSDMIRLDMSDFSNGVYLLKLETETGSIVRKVIFNK